MVTDDISIKDNYQDPITIEDPSNPGSMVINTRMLYNFSHVFLIYNPTNATSPEVFSITYQSAFYKTTSALVTGILLLITFIL